KYPAVFEVLTRFEHSRSLRRSGARRAQDEPGGVPQLVAEAPVALNAALIKTHVLARHRYRRSPCAQCVGAVLLDDFARVDACAEGVQHPAPGSGRTLA